MSFMWQNCWRIYGKHGKINLAAGKPSRVKRLGRLGGGGVRRACWELLAGILLRRAVGEGHDKERLLRVTCCITANHEHLKQVCPRMFAIQAIRKSVSETMGRHTRNMHKTYCATGFQDGKYWFFTEGLRDSSLLQKAFSPFLWGFWVGEEHTFILAMSLWNIWKENLLSVQGQRGYRRRASPRGLSTYDVSMIRTGDEVRVDVRVDRGEEGGAECENAERKSRHRRTNAGSMLSLKERENMLRSKPRALTPGLAANSKTQFKKTK